MNTAGEIETQNLSINSKNAKKNPITVVDS